MSALRAPHGHTPNRRSPVRSGRRRDASLSRDYSTSRRRSGSDEPSSRCESTSGSSSPMRPRAAHVPLPRRPFGRVPVPPLDRRSTTDARGRRGRASDGRDRDAGSARPPVEALGTCAARTQESEPWPALARPATHRHFRTSLIELASACLAWADTVEVDDDPCMTIMRDTRTGANSGAKVRASEHN